MTEPTRKGSKVIAHTRTNPNRVTWVNVGNGVWVNESGCQKTWDDLEDPSPI